ncbi:hypothetical protein K458DRAFT_395713 [Lentithecium fluviatile CBS 122367]|uniref:Uncharacterized protein n=1 Tax=Lentithecium fluviatile CBS 122367 TaxID=1168545 RepID=A0A6G1IHN9_9PLEO|nr:hypothetical protein K458DRAFT_395713 [Lentithecium fluviatile CBS 122367]
MALIHRTLALGIVPLAALILFQVFSPTTSRTIQHAILLYLSKTPLSNVFPGNLPPPSETPLFIAAMIQWSHVEKVASVALALAELGYLITFITARVFQDHIRKLHPNIQFVPM